jgi:hypothetical protein
MSPAPTICWFTSGIAPLIEAQLDVFGAVHSPDFAGWAKACGVDAL